MGFVPIRKTMNRPLLPATRPANVRGFGDADGAVIAHAGRYSRECVLLAFEMIGGVERMASWADRNPELFYTRLFTKVITREVEVNAGQGIEDLLALLDRGGHPDNTSHPTLDAEIIDE
jgi:hypothetical protein